MSHKKISTDKNKSNKKNGNSHQKRARLQLARLARKQNSNDLKQLIRKLDGQQNTQEQYKLWGKYQNKKCQTYGPQVLELQ